MGQCTGYAIDSETGFLSARADEAPTVPLMFESYGKGRMGSAAVAHWLNKRGHRTRNAKLWTAPAVLTVLRNSVYVGQITFRGQTHAAPHMPLVDRDLFTSVQAILKERREDGRDARRTRRPTSLPGW